MFIIPLVVFLHIFGLLPSHVLSQQSTPNTLIAYFTFDGSLRNDAGGVDAYKVGSGATIYVPGKFNIAYTMKGESYLALDASNNIFPDNTPWSFAGFFRTNEITFDDQLMGRRLFTTYREDSQTKFAAYVTKGADGASAVVCMAHTKTNGYRRATYSPPTGLLDNQWHHLSCVVTSVEIRLYYDGTFGATAALGSELSPSSALQANIGSTGTKGYWIGTLDDFRVYTEALTEDHVYRLSQGLALAPIPIPTAASSTILRALYSFENDIVNSANPTTAANADMTGKWVELTATQGSAHYVGDGVKGSAIHFDGTSVVQLGGGNLYLPIQTSFTVIASFRTVYAPSPQREPQGRRIVIIPSDTELSSTVSLLVRVTSTSIPLIACSFGTTSGEYPQLSYPFFFADGYWHTAACVYNMTSKTASLFLDGRMVVPETSLLGSGAGVLAKAGSSPVSVGAFRTAGQWLGDVDEVYLLAMALDESQLQNLTSSAVLKGHSSESPWPTFTLRGYDKASVNITQLTFDTRALFVKTCPSYLTSQDVVITENTTISALKIEVRVPAALEECTAALENVDVEKSYGISGLVLVRDRTVNPMVTVAPQVVTIADGRGIDTSSSANRMILISLKMFLLFVGMVVLK